MTSGLAGMGGSGAAQARLYPHAIQQASTGPGTRGPAGCTFGPTRTRDAGHRNASAGRWRQRSSSRRVWDKGGASLLVLPAGVGCWLPLLLRRDNRLAAAPAPAQRRAGRRCSQLGRVCPALRPAGVSLACCLGCACASACARSSHALVRPCTLHLVRMAGARGTRAGRPWQVVAAVVSLFLSLSLSLSLSFYLGISLFRTRANTHIKPVPVFYPQCF